MLKSLEKAAFSFSKKMNYVSGVALAIMMCLVFFNVVLRTVWRPILGTYDFTGLLASVTVSFALGVLCRSKGPRGHYPVYRTSPQKDPGGMWRPCGCHRYPAFGR